MSYFAAVIKHHGQRQLQSFLWLTVPEWQRRHESRIHLSHTQEAERLEQEAG